MGPRILIVSASIGTGHSRAAQAIELALRQRIPEVHVENVDILALAGTFLASSRFPEAMQPLIRALPLTQINDALRAVILEGATLRAVALPITVLSGWAAISFLAAVVLFRWR